jgi:hypothetical protein
VACILQHVPLRQRLNRCALVCRAWAAVAVAVPADVHCFLQQSQRAAAGLVGTAWWGG